LTRYFCNRGLEQPTAAMRRLVLVVHRDHLVALGPG
jgi:hypothetical protein